MFLVSVREMLRLILKEDPFQFNGKQYQCKPTVPRWAQRQQFPFQLLSMAYIETQSLSKTVFKPTVWKRFIIDANFPLWDIRKPGIVRYRLLRRRSKRTSPCYEIHGRNIWHWDNLFRPGCIPLGTTFNEKWEKAILDVKTPFKRKPSSIYIFTSYHPTIVKMDLKNE